MIENTKVSVIVATYKREASLERAIDSLLRQDYNNIEIIVVDDSASSVWNHKVKAIVDRARENTTRQIFLFTNEVNLGSARSRNRGISEASGDFITFLDDDDVYLQSKISHQVAHMIESKSDYSITDLYLYDEKNCLKQKRIHHYLNKFDKDSLLRTHIMYHLTGTDCMMFRTDYLRKIGGFLGRDEGDEFYLMRDAIMMGGIMSYLPECGVKAYIHVGEDSGLSSGERKIICENTLHKEKQKYFNLLTSTEIRYVNMRHYAVLAYAELRRKKYLKFMYYALNSIVSAPNAFINLVMGNC